jgi:hypothetical protein
MTIKFDKDKIKTTVDVANWLIDTYKSIKEQNKSLLTLISIEVINRAEEMIIAEVAEKLVESVEKEFEKLEEARKIAREPLTPTVTAEPPKDVAANSARPNTTKKRKFEHGNESWLTRRSLRGQDKIELINVTFQDSLKKYTNENYIVEAPKIDRIPNDSSHKDSEKNAVKFKNLSDEDSACIDAFLNEIQVDVDVIFMMKALLKLLALKASVIWYYFKIKINI